MPFPRLSRIRPPSILSTSQFLSLFSLLFTTVFSLTISAPSSCGGSRVLTHATAFFGPRPTNPPAKLQPIFAAYPTIPSKHHKPPTPNDALLDTACGFNRSSNKLTPTLRNRWKKVKGHVGIVLRGNCDFIDKVIALQALGATGVVVINREEEKTNLVNMKINETFQERIDAQIPAVMIRYQDWMIFHHCRDNKGGEGGVKIAFTKQGEAMLDVDYAEYGRDALNWILMRGMALWILCQCGVNAVRYRRRVGEQRARADAIAALPVVRFRKRSRGYVQGEEYAASQATRRFSAEYSGNTVNCNSCAEERMKPFAMPHRTATTSSSYSSSSSSSSTGSFSPTSHRKTSNLLTRAFPSWSRRKDWFLSRTFRRHSHNDRNDSSNTSDTLSNLTTRSATTTPEVPNLHLVSTSFTGEPELHRPLLQPLSPNPITSTSPTPLSPTSTHQSPPLVLSTNVSILPHDNNNNVNDEPLCPICLEHFQDGQFIRRLQCNHEYCKECIDKWLTESSNVCPVCKQTIKGLAPPPSSSSSSPASLGNSNAHYYQQGGVYHAEGGNQGSFSV